MGLFKDINRESRKSTAQETAENLIGSLADSDGRIHVAMFNCFGSLGVTQGIGSDTKFNQQADLIISAIQDAGKEIVDIKFDGQYGVGATGQGISYHILVLYR